jgi:enolase
MKPVITGLSALEILDSRGNPTLEVTVAVGDDFTASAAVPSGASTGAHEALELRDTGDRRYSGRGVLAAARNVETVILDRVRGMDVRRLRDLDHALIELDGTANKSRLGANATLGVSLAVARAGAKAQGLPLYLALEQELKPAAVPVPLSRFAFPTPLMNVVNGGRHADSGLSFQEFLLVPHGATFTDRLRKGAEIFHTLGSVLHADGLATHVGDEGGYAPQFTGETQPLDFMVRAIAESGYAAGSDCSIGLDAAASEFYNPARKEYDLVLARASYSAVQLVDRYRVWSEQYPLAVLEDGVAEDDWEGWRTLTSALGRRLTLVGDDLFVTNVVRIEQGIAANVANAVLIKPNQIGTLTETLAAIERARQARYTIVVSHRSGETCDPFIADLAVAARAEFIKAGSAARGERLAKYNRLLQIERDVRGA